MHDVTIKAREFVMEHPTYGNTLGSSASQPTYYFRTTLKTQNFHRLIPHPSIPPTTRARVTVSGGGIHDQIQIHKP